MPVTDAFKQKTIAISDRLGIEPAHLMAVMDFETGGTLSPTAAAPTSTAVGLIQWTGIGRQVIGKTRDELLAMSAIEQLDMVELYFRETMRWAGQARPGIVDDVYLIVHYPSRRGRRRDTVLYSSPSAEYTANRGLDRDNKGYVTLGDSVWPVERRVPRWESELGRVTTRAHAEIAQRIREVASNWEGVPYLLGGTTRKGIDCSSFVQQVMRTAFPDTNLPRDTASQLQAGRPISRNAIVPGDLVFFTMTGGRVQQHVGIYLGENEFVHAGSSTGANTIASITSQYWGSRWLGARRVLGTSSIGNQSGNSRWGRVSDQDYWLNSPEDRSFQYESDLDTDSEAANSMSREQQLRNLSVQEGEESFPLADLRAPEEGEIDIGDLRFGSVLVRALDESHLNQPTSLTQQNAGAVGTVDLLRTDMNPIIGDNRVLPEAVLTLTLNATYRDDVNRVLRPLVAQQERLPFTVARNSDLARMMLGLGVMSDNRTRLRQIYPQINEEELDELVATLNAQSPAEVWVPITIRSISVQNQPGAPDLYQVHVVLRYANVSPYVPQMLFWETTQDALQWSEYISWRAQQGAQVERLRENGAASIIGFDKRTVHVDTPPLVNQTPSPHQSYPFKKFYRGLLDEYQDERTGGLFREQFESGNIAPIGITTTQPGAVLNSRNEGEGVYEPAYPISDPGRLYEEYRPGVPMEFKFLYLSSTSTREVRMQQLNRSYQRAGNLASELRQTADLYTAIQEVRSIDRLKELGKVSPIILGPARSIGTLFTGTSALLRQMGRVNERLVNDLRGVAQTLPTEIRQYYVSDDGSLGTEGYPVDYGDSPTASGVWGTPLFEPEGGTVRFAVPSTDDRGRIHEEIFVPFHEEVSRLQRTLLRRYADILNSLDKEGSSEWIAFRDRELDALRNDGISENIIRSHPLSFYFLNKLSNESWFRGTENARALESLINAAGNLIAQLNDSLHLERESLSAAFADGAERMEGFLSLEPTAIEGLSLHFGQRYADRVWDGYPHPVTQHIGGANGEVSIEFATNDRLILDQLGEIQQAQLALSEIRKSRDVVPPLLEVYGEGNLLRAFGIRHLAYRAHTTTILENRPGYYNVRLELIQDEQTLINTERLTWGGDPTTGKLFETLSVWPLLVPFINQEDPREGRPVRFRDHLRFHDILSDLFRDIHPPANRANFSYDNIKSKDLEIDIFDVDVRFTPKEQRTAGTNPFHITVRWRGNNTNVPLHERQLEVIDGAPALENTLLPLADFLDQAQNQVDETTFLYLVQRIVNVLRSSGLSSGWVAGIYRYSLLHITEQVRARQQNQLSEWGVDDYGSPPRPEPYVFNDNLSFPIDQVLRGARQSLLLSAQSRALDISADSIARTIVANNSTRAAYFQWLEQRRWTRNVPRHEEEEENQNEESIRPYQFSSTLEQAKVFAKNYLSQTQHLPSAYPDLKMPEIRDRIQGINIVGYDFPLGPGTFDLIEDAYLSDYRYAEAMRTIAMFDMATVGLNTFTEHIRGSHESQGEHRVEIEQYAAAFDAAVDHIRTHVRRHNVDLPQELDPTGQSPDHFSRMARELNSRGAFSLQPLNPLTKRDWVAILRMSQTIKFVSAVMDRLREEAQSGNFGESMTEMLNYVEQYSDSVLAPVDVGQLLEATSSMVDLSNDHYIARLRQQLINLYASDPDTIAGMVGFTDITAQPRRQEILDALKEKWTQTLGMRRAFPTYQMLILGPMGSAHYKMLSDIYAWSAVQSIEIRNQAESAGQYATLVLSNMRQRLRGEDSARRVLLLDDQHNDITLQIQPGTHMAVYTGYGPDVSGLMPFVGRVTGIDPSAVTTIELSSYSTTLNNPPNKGQGFNIDGWDGQASIAHAILYTMDKTAGLEGLGRRDLTAAIDALGRSHRSIADGDEYRTSLMLTMWRMFGSFGLNQIAAEGASREDLEAMISAVTRYGLSGVEERFIGDSRLYENVHLASGRARYGFSNLFLGGFAHWLTSGKGWGWAAIPGETCWDQLKQQSLLFPDYVVTTRPYNVGLPLRDLARHPLRQTLYFGPKHGRYVCTSDPAQAGGAFSRIAREELEMLLQMASRAQLNLDDEDQLPQSVTSQGQAEELYNVLFYRGFLVPTLVAVFQETGEGPGDDALNNVYAWLFGANQANPFTGIFSAGLGTDYLQGKNFSSATADHFERILFAIFPHLAQEILNLFSAAQEELEEGRRGIRGFFNFRRFYNQAVNSIFQIHALDHALGGPWIEKLAEKGKNVDSDASLLLEATKLENLEEEQKTALLSAFLDDLANILVDDNMFVNMTQHNPFTQTHHSFILDFVRDKLLEKGIVFGGEYKSIVQHHFGSMYTSICNNDITAGTDDPDFANRINLQFPKDPDQRLSAYISEPGTRWQYTISANPMISDDFIQEKVIYYPNLRRFWYDDAGLWTRIVNEQGESGSEQRARRIALMTEEVNLLQTQRSTLRLFRDTGADKFLLNERTRRVKIYGDETYNPSTDTIMDVEEGLQWFDRALIDAEGALNDLKNSSHVHQDNMREAIQAWQKLTEKLNNREESVGFNAENYSVGRPNNSREEMPTSQALNIVENNISMFLEQLPGTIGMRPKYNTVAGNILSQSMRHMYGGTVTMAGEPSILPYHIIHLWDDVKQMHGPVEVDGVYHSFGPDGFYTVIQPKLVSCLRGVDPTLDLVYVNYAAYYYAWMSWLRRAGSGISGFIGLAARGSMYYIAERIMGRFISSGATGGAARAATRFFKPILLADAIWTVLRGMSAIGAEKTDQFVAFMAEASDANPVVLIPLNYRARPYVAGLTGAVGPASVRQVVNERLDDARQGGAAIDSGVLDALRRYAGIEAGVSTAQ